MGWTYNTVDPNADTNGPTIAAVGITFTTISLITVCLRMYVRLFMIKAAGADDWIIVCTWFMALGFLIVTLIQSRWGLGLQNLSDMPDENIFSFGLAQYCGAPFYITSILGFKLSLLYSFLRIAVVKYYRVTIICIAAACTAFHICFLIVQLNLCNPISKQWDPNVLGGSCLVAVPFYTTMASITIIFDVIIIITPFPMLIRSQIPLRNKLVLLGIFSIGAFITVIQIIRIFTIKSLSNYLDSSHLIMWSMVENNLGIIVSCVPPLSPLFRYFRSVSANRSGRKTGQRGSSYVLNSIGGGDHKRNYTGNDSGTDKFPSRDRRAQDAVVGLGDIESSTEELNIHPDSKGIKKTTEVMVTRQSSSQEFGTHGQSPPANEFRFA